MGPGLSWLALMGTTPPVGTAPTVGFSPTTPLTRGRADDGAVRLGADGQRREPGGHRRARPRGRAPGAAVEGPRVPDQATGGRPPAGRALGADVGPLRQVRAAQHDGPGVAQPGDEGGSRAGRPTSAVDPAAPGSPVTSMLSLTRTGTPWSAPRTSPRARSPVPFGGHVDGRRRPARPRPGVPTAPDGSSTAAIRSQECVHQVPTLVRVPSSNPARSSSTPR